MKKADFLFMLLQSELLGKKINSFEMSSELFVSLLATAEKQTVTGLICSGLINNNIKLQKFDAIQTYSTLKSIESQNILLNHELAALSQLLTAHGIKFVVVKGQTIAFKYPNPNSRLPGDIDFYCNPSNFEKARQVIQEAWHVKFDESELESEQHIAFSHNQVEYEMHFRLMKFSSSRLQTYFDNLINNDSLQTIEIDNTPIPILSPTVNVIYTFLHLWTHLIELGVGLRQFCDVAILLHKEEPMSTNDYEEILNHLGYTRAFKAIGGILINKLGLPESEFPLPLQKKDRKYEKMILDIVFKRGNFGKFGRKKEVRSGFLYYIEALIIKISHYGKFFWLAPKENLAVITKEIPSKILKALKR
jgi:hypothetical protein